MRFIAAGGKRRGNDSVTGRAADPRLKDNEFNHGRAIRRCFVQGRTMDSGDSSGNQVDPARVSYSTLKFFEMIH